MESMIDETGDFVVVPLDGRMGHSGPSKIDPNGTETYFLSHAQVDPESMEFRCAQSGWICIWIDGRIRRSCDPIREPEADGGDFHSNCIAFDL